MKTLGNLTKKEVIFLLDGLMWLQDGYNVPKNDLRTIRSLENKLHDLIFKIDKK